jgi:hypothetical protein
MFVIVALFVFVVLAWLLDSAPPSSPSEAPGSRRNAWEAHAAHMEDWFGKPHYTFTRPPPSRWDTPREEQDHAD